MGSGINESVEAVRERIQAACSRTGRSPSELLLIAVTKQQEPAALVELARIGIGDFGENRVDHLQLMHGAAPAKSRFHYIGRVQGRQLAKIAAMIASLHSLCEEEHVDRLARACVELHRRMPVFLQVNISGETQKAGIAPDRLPKFIELVRRYGGALELVGLMTMAPDLHLDGVDESDVRRCFATLRELAGRHGLARLSMGMSQDFELAIEEGATDLRIGSLLFPAIEAA